MTDRLGVVVSGSLESGVEVKLDGAVSVEDMAVGRYITIEGQKQRFFGMITDIGLRVIDPRVTLTPPDLSDPFVSEVLSGTSTYGTLHVLPMLTISGDVASLIEGPQPVKTVPSHFSVVNPASQRDVELIFGGEDEKRFYVGTPLDMETRICLDLPELVKRSNGIFGKSGTGKTFLTRILLIGMLQKSAAVNLIFDTVEQVEPLLHKDKPRYLMGIGMPDQIVRAVGQGIERFDTVIHTRYGRYGTAFTENGKVVIRNGDYAPSQQPIDSLCAVFVRPT